MISLGKLKINSCSLCSLNGFKTSVENSKKIGKGASKSKKPVRRKNIKENEKKKNIEAGDKLDRASSRKSVGSESSSRRTARSDACYRRSVRSDCSSKKSRMSLFTSEQPAKNLPLYDTRQNFETSESEPLPSDASTEGSSVSEDNVNVNKSMEQRAKEVNDRKLQETSTINNEEINEDSNLQNVKSFEECKECNGKVINDALSQENIQLLRSIKSREKKLKDTRRQLNEERTFYEQQKMDLCKTIRKKKSNSQVIQTDESALEINSVVQDMESQIANLKKELDKQAQKSSKLKEKCENLRKRNGALKSEISLNEEDYEKSWKEVRDKLEIYKKEYGNAEKNSGIIKNIYDQVVKKNAYLARSNFALQAELRRLYRKFEKIDKAPSIRKFTSNSTIPSASSPDLWRCQDEVNLKKKKKMRRSKTAPGRSNADESSENLVVSGSLISVHVEGDEKRLRPVFLVLEDKRKKGCRKTFFGIKKDGNISDSSVMKFKKSKNNFQQRAKSATNEFKSIQKAIEDESVDKAKNSENESLKQDETNQQTATKKDKTEKNETLTQKAKNINFLHKKKSKTREPTTHKHKNERNGLIEKTNCSGNESPRRCNIGLKNNTALQGNMENLNEEPKEIDNSDLKQKNDLTECDQTYQEKSEAKTVQKLKMNQITESSKCSDSENCIIECRTHSSSVQ